MEPELRQGDFIVFKQVLPQQVKEGDIIVFEVSPIIREQYNYPPRIAHRIIKITRKDGVITLKTKGDNNASPDPFTVRAIDLKGVVSHRIPYFGNLFIFAQSKQGLIVIAIFLILAGFYDFRKEIRKMRRNLIKKVFSPITEDLEKGIERLEEKEEKTRQAIERFASAMAEYAKHLESHTEAIQSLAKASEELREAAKEQTKFFGELTKILEGLLKEKRGG